MFVNKASTPMSSISMKRLQDNFEISLSYFTLLRRIKKKLIPAGYVLEGLKNGNSKSFYLTEEAIKYIKENIFDKKNTLDLYEEVIEEYDDNDGGDING